MNKQDELATLLSQQLCLYSVEKIKCDSSENKDSKIEDKINYSISQHYHHSAHTPLDFFTCTVEPKNVSFTDDLNAPQRTSSPALHEIKEMNPNGNESDEQERPYNEVDNSSRDYHIILPIQNYLLKQPSLLGELQNRIPIERPKNENIIPAFDEDYNMDGDMEVDTMTLSRNNYWEEVPLSDLCSYDNMSKGKFENPVDSEYYMRAFFPGNPGYCYATDPVYNKAQIEFHY